ncbi:MAG: chorismate mutase [Rhodobacteraceae bacterium]|nr:chorismate mutase [Paracoccaceae bacterium]
MSDTVEKAQNLLKEHRQSIDRLDAMLVYTLAERFAHTKAVGKLKAIHELPASDPLREATQIERLEKLSAEADLDPEFAKKLLNFIIQEVIKQHKKHQS